MRFSVEAKLLRSAVNVVGGIVKPGSHLMECVMIEARDNSLRVIASDHDTEAHAKLEAAVQVAGKACVNAADLRAIVKPMAGHIDATLSASGLLLACGPSRMSLPIIAGSLPRLPKPEGEVEVIGGVEAYLSCVDFAATDETRWHQRGVNFHDGFASALDGASFFCTPCDGGGGQIVPAQAKGIISKVGGRLFLSGDKWRVEAQGLMAMGRLIDHPPTEWRKFCPDADGPHKLDAGALLDAVSAVTVGRAAWTAIEATDGGLRVSGDRFKGAHIEGSYELPCAGFDQSLVVDTRILSKSLEPFRGQEVTFSTNGQLVRLDGSNGFSIFAPLRDARTQLVAA